MRGDIPQRLAALSKNYFTDGISERSKDFENSNLMLEKQAE
jgi:hypothetical protein